jgi:hypothetical protein
MLLTEEAGKITGIEKNLHMWNIQDIFMKNFLLFSELRPTLSLNLHETTWHTSHKTIFFNHSGLSWEKFLFNINSETLWGIISLTLT